MSNQALAVAENRSGLEILDAVERALAWKRIQSARQASKPLNFGNTPVVAYNGHCGTNEDSHEFDSTGQCRRCGAHRRPS